MGFGFYELPDGREAGYAVSAQCDEPGCIRRIDRGLDYLCGDQPDGHRDPADRLSTARRHRRAVVDSIGGS